MTNPAEQHWARFRRSPKYKELVDMLDDLNESPDSVIRRIFEAGFERGRVFERDGEVK